MTCDPRLNIRLEQTLLYPIILYLLKKGRRKKNPEKKRKERDDWRKEKRERTCMCVLCVCVIITPCYYYYSPFCMIYPYSFLFRKWRRKEEDAIVIVCGGGVKDYPDRRTRDNLDRWCIPLPIIYYLLLVWTHRACACGDFEGTLLCGGYVWPVWKVEDPWAIRKRENLFCIIILIVEVETGTLVLWRPVTQLCVGKAVVLS